MSVTYTLAAWLKSVKPEQHLIVQASKEDGSDGITNTSIGMSWQYVKERGNTPACQIGQHDKQVLCAISPITDGRRRRFSPINRQSILETLKTQGISNTILEPSEYFKSLPQYKFVISPEGNGIDCHRHYEALMAGCIPIVEDSELIRKKYGNAPILYTRDYSEINETYLKAKYEEMLKTEWDFSKLFIGYWDEAEQELIKYRGNYWCMKVAGEPWYKNSKKCIFCCVFNQKQYVNLFVLLLESIFIYGNLDEDTHILIYTSTEFMKMLKNSHLFDGNKMFFETNDTYDNIDKSCKARLDLFNLPSSSNYSKILYLDTDIIVKDQINKVFDVCVDDVMYVLEEGAIDCETDMWGKSLFGNEIENYADKTAFSSGILLFNNCEKIKFLFTKINDNIKNGPSHFFATYDQPFFVYNSFKYNLYNNKLLKQFVVNNDYNILSDKVIHHFPGAPGFYQKKIVVMHNFLNEIKDYTITNNINNAKTIINTYLLPIIKSCGEPLEGNIFMIHHTTTYTDRFINKAKNISNIVLNNNITKVLEIGFNSGFSALLMLLTNPKLHLTCYDLGEHSYTMPCYNKLKEFFGDRLNIVIGDSTETLRHNNNIYDLIHIDGGHSDEVATSDIINSHRISRSGTILIMDDYDFPNLHILWDKFVEKYKLESLHIKLYNSPHHSVKFVV